MRRKIISFLLMLLLIFPSFVFATDNNILKINIKGEEQQPVSIVVEEGSIKYYIDQKITDSKGEVSFTIPLEADEKVEKEYKYSTKMKGDFQQFIEFSGERIEGIEGKVIVPPGKKADGENPKPPDKPQMASITITGYKSNTILSQREVSINSGETVLSLTQRVLDNENISYEINKGYITSIAGLSEFDKGPESGWMFSINGEFPNVGAETVRVRAGDYIKWFYTGDLGKDIGAGGATGAIFPVSIKNLDIDKAINNAVKWITNNRDFSKEDNFDDWDAFALARAKKEVPDSYYQILEEQVKEKEGNYKLVTDYGRMALAVMAIGKDTTDIEGYNFIEKIYNNKEMTKQGTNGPVFALITLDARKYDVPKDALWTREKLVDWILKQQNRDGGFPLNKESNGASVVDITSMALQSLSNYQDRKDVKKAIDNALVWLSKQQLNNGGFGTWGEENSESVSQTIIALTSLGIDIEDEKFIKDEGNLLNNLISFQNKDGGFSHIRGDNSNYKSTQQALMALVAYDRFVKNQNNLYHMTDIEVENKKEETDKKDDYFLDEALISPWAMEYVRKAYEYGLMSGVNKEELRFDPKRNLTRAEFTALMVKLFEEENIVTDEMIFKDVNFESWYYKHVMTAKTKGWIAGMTPDTFAPNRSITRQEMAVVLSKILKLNSEQEGNTPLDLGKASSWAKSHIVNVYQQRIMVGDEGNFRPQDDVSREMAAVIMVKIYEGFMK